MLALFLALPLQAHADIHLLRQVTLGGEGGWDFVTVDPVHHRLYIPRGSHVMVLDADSLTVVGDVPNTPGVHGVEVVPSAGRGYTTNGRDTSVTVFDLTTLETLGRVRVGLRPDAIVYDPATQRVFTMNAGSNDASAIDVASGTVVATIPLGGRPEVAVCDGKGRMYVNLEDSSQVVAVDTRLLKTTTRWSLAPGEGPTGLAIDAAHDRLFSVCGNQQMVVSDAKRGAVVVKLPIGDRVDGVAFDPGTGLAISSNGEGTLSVVHEESPNAFKLAGTVPTARGARTLALDPQTHRLYLVTADYGTAPEPTAEQPHPRAPMIPGTFRVMVYGE